jgi:hypothetical protein
VVLFKTCVPLLALANREFPEAVGASQETGVPLQWVDPRQRAFLQQRKLGLIGNGPKNPVESLQGPIFQDLVEVEFQPTRISSRLQQAGLFATYQSAGTAERDAWNQLSEAISMELETDKSVFCLPPEC